MDNRFAEIVAQKNSLAYENGKLQSQVEQLTVEIDELKKKSNETDKTERKLAQLDTKLKKVRDLQDEVMMMRSAHVCTRLCIL